MPKNQSKPEKAELRGYVDSRLRDIVQAQADAEDIPLSEMVTRLVAQAVGRPDLAEVPRKPRGRRLGMKMTSNGKAGKGKRHVGK